MGFSRKKMYVRLTPAERLEKIADYISDVLAVLYPCTTILAHRSARVSVTLHADAIGYTDNTVDDLHLEFFLAQELPSR